MNKQTVDDAIGYLSFRMEELKQDDQFYLDILLKYIDNIEHENLELEDQVCWYLKNLTQNPKTK